MKTRILFIIPSFRTGGAEVQLLSLIKGLDIELFEITVAVFYKGHELDIQFEKNSNIRIVYLNKSGPLDLKFLDRLKKIFAEGFDIVQPFNISARYYAIKMAHKFKVPITIATERSAKLLPTSLGSRFFLFLEKFAMRKVTVVVANSEAGREFTISQGVKRLNTKVIYNGIDPARLQICKNREDMFREYSLPKRAKIVGTVGRLEAQKDSKTLVQAASIVSHKIDMIYFIFVGDGPQLLETQELAKKNNIEKNCLFVGNQKNVADYLNIMDVFILASKEIEGCSNAILEAMMLGKPVIATEVGGNREIVKPGKTGEIVQANDPRILAEKITMLLEDDAKKSRYGKNAKDIAESEYSLSTMVKNYQNLYFELLNEHNN